jgi:large subunit ribosomal protein L31e
MADKKPEKTTKKKDVAKAPADEGKVMTINLRKELVGKPYWRRTKDATSILRKILKKKTKSEKILIGKKLNDVLWSRGIQNPAMKLRVKIVKDGETVRAELME